MIHVLELVDWNFKEAMINKFNKKHKKYECKHRNFNEITYHL
jgi:hypothetical protein